MKILAFTDLHGNLSSYRALQAKVKKDKPDCIFCLGDFTIFDAGLEVMLKKISDLKLPTLVIHGNHEDETLVEELCSQYPNLLFVHRKVVELGEYKVVAHGGGGFYGTGKNARDPDFDKMVKSAKQDLAGKIILITHAPPQNAKVDMSAWLRKHVGCSSYADFIHKYKPILALCGHLHENFGVKEKKGTTLIINPGPEGMVFKV